MPTINQLKRSKRIVQRRKKKSGSLEGHSSLRGVVLWAGIRNPKKPNSANRKVCRVKLSNGRVITAYIPGEKHNIAEHHQVLVRGGRVRDLPGVKYHVIRGALDSVPVDDRRQARSKYGREQPNK